MTGGRTVWWAKDATWYDRESNVILGAEFGAEGTTVMDVLSCQAKLENDAGRVKTGYASLTRKGNIGSEEATRRIVARAVELGALDDFGEDRLTFSARVSGWKADQDLARAAARQDQYRKAAAAKGGDGALRSVTAHNDRSPTVQDSKETSSLRSDVVEPTLDSTTNGGQDHNLADLFAYWQHRCGHPHAKLTPERRKKIETRLKQGYTAEQIMRGIDGAAENPPRSDDDSVVYDDLVSICRNGGQLERYIARAEGKATARETPDSLVRSIRSRNGRGQ